MRRRADQLRRSDIVEVRCAAEILAATLGDKDALEVLPFMPDVVAYLRAPVRHGATTLWRSTPSRSSLGRRQGGGARPRPGVVRVGGPTPHRTPRRPVRHRHPCRIQTRAHWVLEPPRRPRSTRCAETSSGCGSTSANEAEHGLGAAFPADRTDQVEAHGPSKRDAPRPLRQRHALRPKPR
jgi:hypothetical protein